MNDIDVVDLHFVEDSADEIFITELMFQRHRIGLQVRHFTDFASYMDFLRELTPSEMTKALCVIDLNLTVTRGTDGIAEIRADSHFDQLLAGICSGSEDPADRKSALDAGAGFFVGKPLNRASLGAVCEAVVDLRLEETADSCRLVRSV